MSKKPYKTYDLGIQRVRLVYLLKRLAETKSKELHKKQKPTFLDRPIKQFSFTGDTLFVEFLD